MKSLRDIEPRKLGRFRGATYTELETAEGILMEELHDVGVVMRSMREEMRLVFKPEDYGITVSTEADVR
jgi:hypothetical protein